VELEFSAESPTYGDSPSAILSWEGPGASLQVIPESAFALPDGSGPGLAAQYQLKIGGESLSISQISPSVEYMWATCRNVAPDDPSLVRALAQHLFALSTDQEYISGLVSETKPAHQHPYFRNYTSTEYLTLSQRQAFLDLLLQSPSLLAQADNTQVLRLYHSLRFADEDAAIDLLGLWAQSQAPDLADISSDFFDANRRFYHTLAIYLACRASDPASFERLQEHYLEMEDGSCCVPAAYAIGFSYFIADRLDEWIHYLDTTLKEESLSGDRRVGWLLARAQAQELYGEPSGRFDWPVGRQLLGRGWLDEASLVAESTQLQLLAASEQISQRASLGEFALCLDEVEHLEQIAGLASHPQLESWKERLAELQQARLASQQEQQEVARSLYLEELERRRNRATSAGDEATASHFEDLKPN
jgi:hypothetical protein